MKVKGHFSVQRSPRGTIQPLPELSGTGNRSMERERPLWLFNLTCIYMRRWLWHWKCICSTGECCGNWDLDLQWQKYRAHYFRFLLIINICLHLFLIKCMQINMEKSVKSNVINLIQESVWNCNFRSIIVYSLSSETKGSFFFLKLLWGMQGEQSDPHLSCRSDDLLRRE